MNLSVEFGSSPLFDFTPATNWEVNTVFYNNVDVTASLVNGVYTLPTIADNALLNVSFVSTLTKAPELVNSNLKVYSNQSDIVVYFQVFVEEQAQRLFNYLVEKVTLFKK